MAKKCTVRCLFESERVESAILLVIRKRQNRHFGIIAVVEPEIPVPNEPLFTFTFVVKNFNKPVAVRILGMNKKKKVISCISRRIRE